MCERVPIVGVQSKKIDKELGVLIRIVGAQIGSNWSIFPSGNDGV